MSLIMSFHKQQIYLNLFISCSSYFTSFSWISERKIAGSYKVQARISVSTKTCHTSCCKRPCKSKQSHCDRSCPVYLSPSWKNHSTKSTEQSHACAGATEYSIQQLMSGPPDKKASCHSRVFVISRHIPANHTSRQAPLIFQSNLMDILGSAYP